MYWRLSNGEVGFFSFVFASMAVALGLVLIYSSLGLCLSTIIAGLFVTLLYCKQDTKISLSVL